MFNMNAAEIRVGFSIVMEFISKLFHYSILTSPKAVEMANRCS